MRFERVDQAGLESWEVERWVMWVLTRRWSEVILIGFQVLFARWAKVGGCVSSCLR